MSSFAGASSRNPNEGSADEFTICRLLVPSRIIEHYMGRATALLETPVEIALEANGSDIIESVVPRTPELTMLPHAEQYDAAVLFADISGFSHLAEELQKELGDAANAAEDLSNYVGNSLNKMVEVITGAGGDVIKFAGDAILAVFATSPGNNLAACTLTACRVSLDLLNLDLSAGGVQLSVHSGIGVGTLLGYHVGGLNGRWEYFIAGPVIEQFGSAEKEAEAGEVVISSEALVYMVHGIVACMPKSAVPRALRDIMAADTQSSDKQHPKQVAIDLEPIINAGDVPVKVQRLLSETGNYKLTELGVSGRVQQNNLAAKDKRKSVVDALNPDSPACAILLRALKCYIPGPVLLSITAKQSLWSAQFWLCSTMFIRIEGLTYESLDYVDHLQEVLYSIQQQLYEYQGTLCRMIVDDKGTGILAAFGLPPFAQHENDSVRGTKVAMNVVELMATKFNHACSVGVTSGRVYAGVVGGRTRCEYTLHGSVVNLAARLMVAAGKSGDGVLVNDVVFRGANNEIEFNDPRRIRCKGYDYPVPVYRPHAVREEPLEVADEKNDIRLICAERELSVLKSALTQAAQIDCGGLIMVEGEAGMGKSRFCRFITHTGKDSGFNPMRAASYDSAPPYYVWRQLLSQMLDLKRYRSSQEKMFKTLLNAIPEHQIKLAPLLRDVFIGVTDDSVETATLTGQSRSEELANLIMDMLRLWFAKYEPEILSKRKKGIIHMKSNIKRASRGNNSIFGSKRDEEEEEVVDTEGLDAQKLTTKAMKLLGMQDSFGDDDVDGMNAHPESPHTMMDENKSQHTHNVKNDSFRYEMSMEPERVPHVGHMIICEDAHWMDDASVSLLLRAVCEFPDVLFVISARPTGGMVIGDYINQLLSFEDTVHLNLQPFTESQVEESIKLIVEGATSVNRKLVKSVYKRVQGHPMFTLELIKMLKNMDKLTIDGDSQGRCSLAAGISDLTELALPDTVRGLMTGRLNRIDDNETRARMQQVLKVASVFGAEFPVDLLLDILPREELLAEQNTTTPTQRSMERLKADVTVVQQQKHALLADIGGLEEMGFISKLSAPTGSTEGVCYRFDQSMMRQCAYDMLLFEHRRNYHNRIAKLLESRNAGCVDLVYAELGQHFFKAEDALKALEYLEKAAQMHFAAYQMEAAKNCFSRLLRITGNIFGDLPPDIRERAWNRGVQDIALVVTRLKKAQWTRFMGEIFSDQQEYEIASNYFLSALEILQLPAPPSTRASRIMSNFKLNRPTKVSRLRDSLEPDILLEGARIYSCIGSNAEAQHARFQALAMVAVPYPLQRLENIYLHSLQYALASNSPNEPGFVVACSNMAATLANANGSSKRSTSLFDLAENQLGKVTDIKAQISVRTNLVRYALLECNYSRAEEVLKKLIWTAHFHHLRAVQLRGLEMMWVIKRMEGKSNDMMAVAAEIRQIEPVHGLLFEAFTAAEVGDFEECGHSLEGVRRLSGTQFVNRGGKIDRISIQERQERISLYKEGGAAHSRVAKRMSINTRKSKGTRGSNSPRGSAGVDLETAVCNANEFLDVMPKTVSIAAAIAHYCLSIRQSRSAIVAALRGLIQYREGVVEMSMLDYFTISSCFIAVCQAQVLQPALLSFSEDGKTAEFVLQQTMGFLFNYARAKPCCKAMKKYVRGWNAARKPKTRSKAAAHWNKGVHHSGIHSMSLDITRLQLSTLAMNVMQQTSKEAVKQSKSSKQPRMSTPVPLGVLFNEPYKVNTQVGDAAASERSSSNFQSEFKTNAPVRHHL